MNFTRPILFWIAMLAAVIAVVALLREVLLPFVAGMVLAYLLEGHAECMGKLSLADAQRLASHPYPAADILIDPVWGSHVHETSAW